MKHFKARNKDNASPQFPDDGISAHTMHSGRKGGNKLDHKMGAEVGKEMLEELKKGTIQIVSVDPPEYADPAKLQALNESVLSGKAKQTEVVTSDIAKEGQPRTKRLEITLAGAAIPKIAVEYKLKPAG